MPPRINRLDLPPSDARTGVALLRLPRPSLSHCALAGARIPLHAADNAGIGAGDQLLRRGERLAVLRRAAGRANRSGRDRWRWTPRLTKISRSITRRTIHPRRARAQRRPGVGGFITPPAAPWL